MSEIPSVWVLLTTYQRRDLAIRTIRGIKQYLQWPRLGWLIGDDGTGGDHIQALKDEIGTEYDIDAYDGMRRGVSHTMNWGLRRTWEMGASLTLLLEDDWELREPLDLTPYVNLLNREGIGMVRMGYLSSELVGDTFSAENKLWLRLHQGPQYAYAGHANLRHRRLHDSVGMFTEGLTPGENELNFCGRYNAAKNPPSIVWDMDYDRWGIFHHIGQTSLADSRPEA